MGIVYSIGLIMRPPIGNLMKTSTGVTTNFAFTNMMIRVLNEYAFTHICVAFDAGKRPSDMNPLRPIRMVGSQHHQNCRTVSISPWFTRSVECSPIIENYEADDIIGTLSNSQNRKI